MDTKLIEQVRAVVQKVDGIKGCSNIRTRKLGHYSMIDLAIELDPNLVNLSPKLNPIPF